MKDIEILNEIHKGAKMGMDSIAVVSEKVADINFKDDLTYQYNTYRDILNQSANLLEKYDIIPSDTPITQKVMGWAGIQMNTINDKSNSQISDLLIQGSNMGVIKGIQLLNSNPDLKPETKTLLNDYVHMQENNINRLKAFL